MEDVLEVYHRPYDSTRPLVCFDEAAKQLLADVRTPLPLRPGSVERVDGEYKRQGTAALFMVCEPLAGRRHVFVREQRTRLDFAAVVKTLCDELDPAAEKIVLVLETNSIPTAWPACTRLTYPRKPAAWPRDWKSITRPNTEAG